MSPLVGHRSWAAPPNVALLQHRLLPGSSRWSHQLGRTRPSKHQLHNKIIPSTLNKRKSVMQSTHFHTSESHYIRVTSFPLRITYNNNNIEVLQIPLKTWFNNTSTRTLKAKTRDSPCTSLSGWQMRWLRAGRHCFTTSNGGDGFLFLQRLLSVHVTFLKKECCNTRLSKQRPFKYNSLNTHKIQIHYQYLFSLSYLMVYPNMLTPINKVAVTYSKYKDKKNK